MKFKMLFLSALVAALSGCWTLRETEYPKTSVTALPQGKELKVQLAGFDAALTSYVPVYGYETAVVPRYGRHGYGHYYATTVATETYVPQSSATPVFRDRAMEAFEKGGYTLQAPDPTYRVQVTFAGPFNEDGDSWKSFAWNLFTVFTADQANQTWTAKLRISDLRTGKLLLFKEYSQPYDVLVWGPIPIFSPAGSSKTRFNTIQCWCLTALTDLAVGDATAFLSKQAQ